MLSIVRRLIGKNNTPPPRPQPTTITIDQLDLWISTELEHAWGTLTERLERERTSVDDAIHYVKEALTGIENAELMNPNIPSRAMQLMHGNRGEITRSVRQAIDALAFPQTADNIPAFLDTMYDTWPAFAKSIARPSAILSEFFANEIRALSAALHQVEDAIAHLRDAYTTSGIPSLNTLRSHLNDLHERERRLTTLITERDTTAASLKNHHNQRERLINEQHAIEELPALREQRERATTLETARAALAQNIRDTLAPLEPAFRKYAYIAFHHRKLLEAYATDPVEALASDVGLKLADMLIGLKRALDANELDLRDRKRDKAAETLNRLTKEELIRIQTSYGHAARDATAVTMTLATSETQRKLDAARRGIAAADEQIAAAERTLTRLGQELAALDIDNAKASIKQQAAIVLGGRITVS